MSKVTTIEEMEADRRRGPQGKRGPSGGEAVGKVLSAPLRAVKGALSGDEDIWYEKPEWMSHEAWAATQVAGDIAGDPLNLIGAGVWGKGANAANKIFGNVNDASKGMITANADNYLPSFYRPDPEAPLTGYQKAAEAGLNLAQKTDTYPGPLKQAKGLSPEETRGAAQKLGSTIGSVVEGGKNAFINILSPEARALWREQGISYGGRKIIDGHLKRHDELTGAIEKLRADPNADPNEIQALLKMRTGERSSAKAGAEAIYQLHNATQGARTGKQAEALQNFAKQVFDEMPQPNKSGTITDISKRHSPKVKDADGKWVDRPISDSDASFIEQHVQSAWPGTADVVVKTPAKKVSGDHLYDIAGIRNPNMMFIRSTMKKDPPPAGVAWKDHVAKRLEEYNKKAEYKVTMKTNGDDVWLVSSRPGSAIVEGGYNGLHKFEPDGTYTGIMSDEHNFLENIPGLGKVVQKMLPRNLVAITPPIKGQVGWGGKKVPDKFKLQSTARREELAGQMRRGEVSGRTPAEQNLRDIAAAKPSKEAVTAERQRTGGMLTSLGAAAYQPEKEQLTAGGLPVGLMNAEEQEKHDS